MGEWEYKKINLSDAPRRRDEIDLLNDAGQEGWELVSITSNSMAYLKRQPQRSQTPPPSRQRTARVPGK